MNLRIAAQTRMFAQPLKKALHTAAAIGCDGVQIDGRHELAPTELSDTGVRQLRKLLDDLNLRVGSVVFPTRRGYGDPQDLERRVEATVGALRLASQLRASVLICHIGNIPSHPDSPEQTTLVEVMGSLGAEGIRRGVQIAAQARFDSFDQLTGLLELLPEGSLFLDLHPARLLADGHAPSEYVTIVGKYVVHVHAADVVRDFASGQNLEVELGRGSVEFPALLGQLEEYNYRGWLTIERRDSDRVIEACANAVKFLRAL